MDAVLDTNLYYKNQDRVEAWLKEREITPYFSPNNALEIITPSGKLKGDELPGRQQAAKNLLALTDDGKRAVLDTEMLHASLVGYAAPSKDDWPSAVRRFSTVRDLSPASLQRVGLNLAPAQKARETAYGAFRAKVETLQKAFHNIWSEKKDSLKEHDVTYELFRSAKMVRGAIERWNVRESIQREHIARICRDATQMELSGALDEAKQSDKTKIYCDAYVGYVIYAISTGKLDKNDFGDLQFFACCDAGYRLVGAEKRWHEITENEGLAEYLIPYP